jgi:hypothetical protein
MKVKSGVAVPLLLLFALAVIAAPNQAKPNQEKLNEEKQDWTHSVRIGAYGLQTGNAGQIIRRAQASGVFGIEVDNDIPGRYESFLHPEEKLKAIRVVARAAHRAGNYAFVYIAGTECITAHSNQTAHTLAKDHPEWLQRKVTGDPAIFGGGTAFWIAKGDEDVWVSPYATEWRKTYMERVRQIARTGVDGIYVDIPYWMTHFDGWEDSWASFDDYTVAAFKQQTGLDAKHDLRLGDFSDQNFRKWVEFRIQTITDFLREIDRNAKSVNPKIKTIPEIYPGIEEEAVRVGADVYSLYPLVDAIAHEYEFGSGDHMAASRSPLDWFRYQVGMHSFRAFAQGKPTWILNYSWDGDKRVDAREAMMNLAVSEIMAGANFWDAPGHSMAGSNDLPTRKKIFSWIKSNEKILYSARVPIDPIGVYFSPDTRNFYAQDFIPSYRGILILLMQKHLEFQIVTPRTLTDFRGRTLILPDVRALKLGEKDGLRTLVEHGKRLIITGTDVTGIPPSANVLRLPDCPGKIYNAALEKDFEAASLDTQRAFFADLKGGDTLHIEASPQLATSIARTSDGNMLCYFSNFAGLRGGINPIQTLQRHVRVTVPSSSNGKGLFLQFLGRAEYVSGIARNGHTVFDLPPIAKGGVFWYVP